MIPYLADPDVTLYQGDAVECLRTLPDESVHMCVTSPPFYGLRDYGTGRWEGGDADCSHQQGRPGSGRADGIVDDRMQRNRDGAGAFKNVCKCGARRVDQQIGLEETPSCQAHGLMRLRSDLTEAQRAFVAQRLLGVEIPGA